MPEGRRVFFATSEDLTDVSIYMPQRGAEGKRSKYHITLRSP